jgi:hypothetical protein
MRLEDISPTLQTILDSEVHPIAPGIWGGTTPNFHLLILLSKDQTELQILLSLIPVLDTSAHPEVITAYAGLFQKADYTVLENMVWAVFPYPLDLIDAAELTNTALSLFERHEHFLIDYHQSVADKQMRRIIQTSKQSGRSLDGTLQFLEYIYRENLLGELLEEDEPGREAVLARWRSQIIEIWEAEDG